MSRGNSWYLTRLALENASSAQRDAQRVENQAEHHANDIERLFMITEALWDLLKKEHGYTDEVLGNVIRDLDLRDGTLNSRAVDKTKLSGLVCPACGKRTSARQPLCIYCGKPVPIEPFAR